MSKFYCCFFLYIFKKFCLTFWDPTAKVELLLENIRAEHMVNCV